MDIMKQKGKKINPIVDIFNKFKYSFQGMAYCFTHETSFIFETIAMIMVVIGGIIFKVSFMEWIFSVLSLLLVMEVEFLNTAIEATVDMVTEKFHPLAKIAKDCGSAATCMASFMALIVNLIIFVPKVLPFIIK
ncbi:MAG: diacylglycerol kinase [Firmicutes bacterium]|nr:diacylglycerol kinase [Bacillota bacterium]